MNVPYIRWIQFWARVHYSNRHLSQEWGMRTWITKVKNLPKYNLYHSFHHDAKLKSALKSVIEGYGAWEYKVQYRGLSKETLTDCLCGERNIRLPTIPGGPEIMNLVAVKAAVIEGARDEGF